MQRETEVIRAVGLEGSPHLSCAPAGRVDLVGSDLRGLERASVGRRDGPAQHGVGVELVVLLAAVEREVGGVVDVDGALVDRVTPPAAGPEDDAAVSLREQPRVRVAGELRNNWEQLRNDCGTVAEQLRNNWGQGSRMICGLSVGGDKSAVPRQPTVGWRGYMFYVVVVGGHQERVERAVHAARNADQAAVRSAPVLRVKPGPRAI